MYQLDSSSNGCAGMMTAQPFFHSGAAEEVAREKH
jgi:hypothetical protein